MKKKIVEAVLYRGIGSLSQLGLISFIGFIDGFESVGEFSVVYAAVFIASQIMKPGLEYFILSQLVPGSHNNYQLVIRLFIKIVTPVFLILNIMAMLTTPYWDNVEYYDILIVLISAYFISAMHLIAEVEKAEGNMFNYSISKMAGINFGLLIYYIIKAIFFDFEIIVIDFFLVISIVFITIIMRVSKKYTEKRRKEKKSLVINSAFINYSLAGLLLSFMTLGYPLILKYFISNQDLGMIFSLQKFAAVLTILSSSIYTASTKDLILKRNDLKGFKFVIFKYYLIVQVLCILYCISVILAIVTFDFFHDVREIFFKDSWLVFLPEIIIVLTGPTIHVINILKDSEGLKLISYFQMIGIIFSVVFLVYLNYFGFVIKPIYLYLLISFPIVFSQLYSLKRMLGLIGFKL